MPIEIVETIVFSTIGLLIVLNVILNINYYKNDTINVVIKNWSYNRYFFITFLWGVFGGHFFLGSKEPIIENWIIPPVLLALIVIGMIIYGKKLPKGYVVSTKTQVALLVAGLLFGHFLWSQRHEESIDFIINL